MARNEHDHRDFFAEAVALVRRTELAVKGNATDIIIGFRHRGALSLYFGSNLNFHFNLNKEIRRCFVGNLLYKAEERRLVSMYRRRSKEVVALVRNELSDDEQEAMLKYVLERIRGLRNAISEEQYEIKRQIPDDSDLLKAYVEWADSLDDELTVAESPNVK